MTGSEVFFFSSIFMVNHCQTSWRAHTAHTNILQNIYRVSVNCNNFVLFLLCLCICSLSINLRFDSFKCTFSLVPHILNVCKFKSTRSKCRRGKRVRVRGRGVGGGGGERRTHHIRVWWRRRHRKRIHWRINTWPLPTYDSRVRFLFLLIFPHSSSQFHFSWCIRPVALFSHLNVCFCFSASQIT